jgi:hypothetical protein
MASPHTSSGAQGASARQQAYDDSPPRNGTIFFYTLLAIFLLVCVKFLLDSYFFKIMDTEIHDKVLTQGMEEVAAMRAAEEEQRAGVKSAMDSLASRGRAAMPQIKPAADRTKAPSVEGWNELKRPGVVAPAGEAAPAPGAAPGAESAPAPGAEPPAGPGAVPQGQGAPGATGGEPAPSAEPANPPTSVDSTTPSR